MSINRRITAYEAIRRALTLMGLSAPLTIAGNTDTMSVQFWSILRECGLELLTEFSWQFFNKTQTITTTPPTLTYDIPSDFEYYEPMTGWNQTSQFPLSGPVSPQVWASIKAQALGGVYIQLQYRMIADQLEFDALPSTAQTLTLSYFGRGWVRDASTPTLYKDQPDIDGDTVLYDPRLIVAMLIWKWREKKGFDTTAAKADYDNALKAAKAKDAPGKDLYLNTRNAVRLIDYSNVPETGYGS